jgi:glycosyltransferase involved in cell wall biosynthesis
MSQLVSILIPAFNVEEWIEETIQSAIGQTWFAKEIIIVDDGSRDRTLQLARRYESKNLKVLHQDNKGASAARNHALRNAQGSYIQWLDADDILAPDKISEQMKVATDGGSDLRLLSSSFATFYWRLRRARFAPTPLWQDLTPIEYLLSHLGDGYWMNPAVWLVSRRLTERAGPWNEKLSLNDDGEYFCRIASLCESIKFIQKATIYYRASSFGQLSQRRSEAALASLVLSLKLSIQYLMALEHSERTRHAGLSCLQSRMWYFSHRESAEVESMDALARQLGGGLAEPEYNYKVNVLRMLCGRKLALKTAMAYRKLALATAVKWDKTLYRITKAVSL